MAFIRIKKISGTPYGYLVESVHTPVGPRQKVKKYLGRVHVKEKVLNTEPSSSSVKSKKELLLHLVGHQLEQHGFKEKKGKHTDGSLVFSPSLKVSNKKKNTVLALNDGYLCSFTLKRILSFKKSDDVEKDARVLAKYFLDAGIPISEEKFVEFYQLL